MRLAADLHLMLSLKVSSTSTMLHTSHSVGEELCPFTGTPPMHQQKITMCIYSNVHMYSNRHQADISPPWPAAASVHSYVCPEWVK